MRPIRQVGFFHFGSMEKDDPVGSLEFEMAKYPEAQLRDSLLVLPEAFNARGGYYNAAPALDSDALPRLQRISAERGIVFVAALVDRIKGPMSAYLLDGTAPPQWLTSKRTHGWRCLYTGSETKEDRLIPHREVGIGALICDDAACTFGDAQKLIVERIKNLMMKHTVLCIPSCMTITDSRGTASRWGNSITVALANGSSSQASVLVHRGCELRNACPFENEIKLCDLDSAGVAEGDTD